MIWSGGGGVGGGANRVLWEGLTCCSHALSGLFRLVGHSYSTVTAALFLFCFILVAGDCHYSLGGSNTLLQTVEMINLTRIGCSSYCREQNILYAAVHVSFTQYYIYQKDSCLSKQCRLRSDAAFAASDIGLHFLSLMQYLYMRTPVA